MTEIERLKAYLLETDFPYFTNDALNVLLLIHDNDVAAAAYDGCMQKAQDDSIALGPIKINSNEKFWLRRASIVKAAEYKYQKSQGKVPNKVVSLRRYDD